MEDDLNNQEENNDNNTQQNNTENMYSYRDNSQNVPESGAIRRSMGDMNPSNVNYYNNKYNLKNKNNNDIYDNNNQFDISEKSSENKNINNMTNYHWITFLFIAGLEAAIIFCLALLLEIEFNPREFNKSVYDINQTKEEMKNSDYAQIRDLNIIVFIGFGLLHSILKRNAWTCMLVNMLLIAFAFQVALFFNFVWGMAFKETWAKGTLDFQYISEAIFISSSVAITYGSVLGKVSILQYLVMAFFEVILVTMNFQLGKEKLELVDTGGAIYVHTFGAVFAISVNVVLFCSTKAKEKLQRYESLNRSSYFSNITSFLGLLFLFIYLPNFNGVLSMEYKNINRARINTYLSLFGSVVGSLVTSGIVNQGKIVLEQILYGTLSGGIIISGCCSVCFYLWAALIVGTLSGAIAVALLSKLKPVLIELGLRDTCNVLLTHGVFGILGGFISPMFISGLNKEKIGGYKLFIDINRSAERQAGIQVGGLFISIGISFIGGIATGFLMKVSLCNEINWPFTDAEYFKELNDDRDLRLANDDDKGSQPSYN